MITKPKIEAMILDGTNFCFRAGMVSGFSLSTKGGEDTTVVFAMLNMIRHLIDVHKPSQVCVVWDWGGSEAKEFIHPEYKAPRKLAREQQQQLAAVQHPLLGQKTLFMDIGKQIKDLQSVLPHFGLKQIRLKGVEADDVIGLLCESLIYAFKIDPSRKILVVSSDKDLLQLVDLGALVYYPPKDVLVKAENFEELFDVPPYLYLHYRAVIGETGKSSDNIPGLKGFGPKTSKKLIMKYGPWENWFEKTGLTTGKISEELRLKEEILNDLNKSQKDELSSPGSWVTLIRNYTLMRAGFFVQDRKEEVSRLFWEQEISFKEDEIRKYFLDRQFESYLGRFYSWIHPFSMMAYHQAERRTHR